MRRQIKTTSFYRKKMITAFIVNWLENFLVLSQNTMLNKNFFFIYNSIRYWCLMHLSNLRHLFSRNEANVSNMLTFLSLKFLLSGQLLCCSPQKYWGLNDFYSYSIWPTKSLPKDQRKICQTCLYSWVVQKALLCLCYLMFSPYSSPALLTAPLPPTPPQYL